jgi:hypothetical protein
MSKVTRSVHWIARPARFEGVGITPQVGRVRIDQGALRSRPLAFIQKKGILIGSRQVDNYDLLDLYAIVWEEKTHADCCEKEA